MKAGTLLRIGIYLVGLWALYSGITSVVYYGYSILTMSSPEVSDVLPYRSGIFGSGVAPLMFSLMCFGFAGQITRRLLGAAADEVIAPLSTNGVAVTVSVKVLSLYLLGVFVGPMIATFFELAAIRSGNLTLSELQVMSDLIANGFGIAFALWLGLRTPRVVAMFFGENEKRA